MKIYHKNYSGYKKEYFEMRNLLIESYCISDKPLNWLIGRLDNWRYASFTKNIRENPRYFQDNAHLWKNEKNKLLGFFISENGKNYFEIQIHPEHRYIENEILEWISANWRKNREKIITNIYYWDEDRKIMLESFGFKNHGLEAIDFRYNTANYTTDEKINDDFHFETFSENFNYKNHIETQRLAFGRTKDQLDREWFETKCMAPGYSAAWDFSVVDSKGDHLAFCIAWLDEINKIAEVDPVGTHPNYRKIGLAKAVITNCFIQLNKAGIHNAQIIGFSEPAKRLYRSLNSTEEHEIIEFILNK